MFCAYLMKALRAVRRIKDGTVNCYCEGDNTTPSGRYKLSSFGGRDYEMRAFVQYSKTKTIWIDLNEHGLDTRLDRVRHLTERLSGLKARHPGTRRRGPFDSMSAGYRPARRCESSSSIRAGFLRRTSS